MAGGQIQLAGPGNGMAPAGPRAVIAPDSDPGVFRPGWRAVLESRWRDRLATVAELAVAYLGAAERPPDGYGAAGHAGSRQLRALMREAVAARRALADTEDALARLSAGRFGRCEQCGAALPAAYLARAPESRYYARCGQPVPHAGDPGAPAVTAR